MNKRIKKLWVEALKGGEYEQGTKLLCNQYSKEYDKFCCLGVLCNLHSLETEEGWFESPCLDGAMMYSVAGESGAGVPPIPVKIWAGLEDKNIGKLVELNDNKGATFQEIAKYIEENL